MPFGLSTVILASCSENGGYQRKQQYRGQKHAVFIFILMTSNAICIDISIWSGPQPGTVYVLFRRNGAEAAAPTHMRFSFAAGIHHFSDGADMLRVVPQQPPMICTPRSEHFRRSGRHEIRSLRIHDRSRSWTAGPRCFESPGDRRILAEFPRDFDHPGGPFTAIGARDIRIRLVQESPTTSLMEVPINVK